MAANRCRGLGVVDTTATSQTDITAFFKKILAFLRKQPIDDQPHIGICDFVGGDGVMVWLPEFSGRWKGQIFWLALPRGVLFPLFKRLL